VIYGERGSRACVLNGAAARTCQRGDPVIIVARTRILPASLVEHRPRIALFTPDNHIERLLEYRVSLDAQGRHAFRIAPVRATTQKARGRRGGRAKPGAKST
jgi:aspartate 1-decarboxylase